MVEIALTKMSSKGQIVIPSSMRTNFKEGDSFIIIKEGVRLVLKQISEEKSFEEDLEFANKTDEALNRVKNGKRVPVDFDDFIEDMKTW